MSVVQQPQEDCSCGIAAILQARSKQNHHSASQSKWDFIHCSFTLRKKNLECSPGNIRFKGF